MRQALLVLTAILTIQLGVPQPKTRAQEPSGIKSTKVTPEQRAELDEAARISKEVVELYNQQKYGQALPLAERVVEIRKRILGDVDGSTVAAVINLAELHMAKEDYGDAQKLYEQLAPIYERAFGKDHINGTLIVDSLALINYVRGNYKQAEELYTRSLLIKEKALGPNHADVGRAVYMLAEFYRSRREYQKAEPLYLRAVAIEDQNPSPGTEGEPRMTERYMCFLYESKSLADAEKLLARFQRTRNPNPPNSTPGGVLNGKAKSLPAPHYPPEAHRMHLGGVVLVEVAVDETGKVVEAKTWCGHPILAKASLPAALAARFTPTKLSGMPIKVKGIIIYNFEQQR